MRFNVKEIKELASQHHCEKEGNLFFRERQEGFFRKQEGLSCFYRNTKIRIINEMRKIPPSLIQANPFLN